MSKIFGYLALPKLTLPQKYSVLSPRMKRAIRHQYVENQEGKCWHCEGSLGKDPPPELTKLTVHEELFPRSFFEHPVHLHHDHDTGLTVGAVHAWCNAVLWQYHGE